MSGAASLSSAKRRRSGGVNNNNNNNNNQVSNVSNEQTTPSPNNIVRLANTSNVAEALNIHDQILVESIKQINSHTTQFTAVNETLKKVGLNENGIHERLLKVEDLLNKLLEKTTSTAETTLNCNKEEVDTIKSEVTTEINETLKNTAPADEPPTKEMKDNTPTAPTGGSYRTKKRGKKNNVSLSIDDAA